MVSVIIPVYQVSDYIERCIRSVMSQTTTDIECIIVDDATEDDSIVKCERLIKEYNDNVNLDHNHDHNLDGKGRIRFKILHHEMNRGLSAARNTGTKAATGEYVFYLDSDDEMTPDCMEKMMLMAEKYPEAEMVIGGYQTIENGRVRSFQKGDASDYVVSNEKIVSLYVCVCTDDNYKLLGEDYSRKPCLKEYNETQMLAEMGKQFCPNGKLPGLEDLKTYSLQGFCIGQCAEQHAANELLKGLGCHKNIKKDIIFGKAVRCVTGEEWPYCKNCQDLFNI